MKNFPQQTLVVIVGPLHVGTSEDGRLIGQWGNFFASLPEYAASWEAGTIVCLHALWNDVSGQWEAQQLTQISQVPHPAAAAAVNDDNSAPQSEDTSDTHLHQNDVGQSGDAGDMHDNPFAGINQAETAEATDESGQNIGGTLEPSLVVGAAASAPAPIKPKFSFGAKSAAVKAATPAVQKPASASQQPRPYAAARPVRPVLPVASVPQAIVHANVEKGDAHHNEFIHGVDMMDDDIPF